MEFYPVGGGSSSIELNRTAKGDYTWSMKLYFVGHDMRTIKAMLGKIMKARRILEGLLDQKVIPEMEMNRYMKQLKLEFEEAEEKHDAHAP